MIKPSHIESYLQWENFHNHMIKHLDRILEMNHQFDKNDIKN